MKSIFLKSISIISILSLIVSCNDDAIPKPKAHLRLDYPKAKYDNVVTDCGYSFEKNDIAKFVTKNNCGYQIEYPKMKATIYLNHKTVNNNIDSLLKDAQKLTYEHVRKADDITEQPFINSEKKVYGMFYLVGGNAATNTQFYVTDSTKNFVIGSAYFYAKPNFDSILPAVHYIQNDMRLILETLEWKN